MGALTKSTSKIIILFIIVAGLIPIGWFWFAVGRLPTVTAVEAFSLLNQPDSRYVLIDVREAGDFESGHIIGAVNWPLSTLQSDADWAQPFQDEALLILSAGGIKGAQAVNILQQNEGTAVSNVRGGLQGWIRALRLPENQSFTSYTTLTGTPLWQNMPISQQIAAVTAGYVVKPIYMTLSVLLVILLWRLKAADLAALRWGMIFFFVGEAFCAINYLFFEEEAYWAEYLHSYGMVIAFTFAAYALIVGLDNRVIKLSSAKKRCAFLELCGDCIKYKQVRCGATRALMWGIPFAALLAFIPLAVAPVTTSYNTRIAGTPYNYSHLNLYQQFELRYLPVLTLVAFGLSWWKLWPKRNEALPQSTKFLTAAGLGTLGFTLFRMLLIGIYQDNLMWATF